MILVVATLALVVAGACSDGGTAGAADATTTTAADATAGSDAASIERYCELAQALDYAEVPGLHEGMSDEEMGAAFQAFVNHEPVQEVLDEIEQVAPPEIRADVAAMVATTRELGATGDLSVYDEGFRAANQRVLAWELSGCPWRMVDPDDADAAEPDVSDADGTNGEDAPDDGNGGTGSEPGGNGSEPGDEGDSDA